MITLFCLLILGGWPSQVGVPMWAVVLSLGVDIIWLVVTRPRKPVYRRLRRPDIKN